MSTTLSFCLIALISAGNAIGQVSQLDTDWLVNPAPFKASVTEDAAKHDLVLENGLARRVVRIAPNAATVDLQNLVTGEHVLRAIAPEARVTIDGVQYAVGGLQGQPVSNYIKAEWLDTLTSDPRAYRFTGFAVSPTEARFPWQKRLEWMSRDLPWPPPGKHLVLYFQPPAAPPATLTAPVVKQEDFSTQTTWRAAEQAAATASRSDLPVIEVHYEIYDGIPLFSKWIVVRNNASGTIRLNRFVAEELRFAEPESNVGGNGTVEREHPNLYVETDYAFGGNMSAYLDNPAVQYGPDPDYPTQVNYEQKAPCLLRCEPPEMGPDAGIDAGKSFESFRVFDLLLDSTERERRTLAQRRMYRTIAPWTAENPLMFHKIASDPATVREAIDQAHDAGFEMVIMSFSSGFNFESTDPAYIATYKQLADYGREKGVALGGYSLLASRGAGTPADNTQGQPVRYGVMPCLGSLWGDCYLEHIKSFCAKAGLGVFENDGSYPGDRCAATNHPFHHGLADSQWVQWRAITDLYKWCTGHGVYLNIPDWYFLSGGTKCAMGYREGDWSLQRAEQELIERQNTYNGTWNKTASMGWMFVPLSEYHGGGQAATIEPLHEHLDHYEARLADLLGYGVQACWRGPRLYDTGETRAMVQKGVTFYKTHRQVLDGDIIHLQRPNGLDWDGILHVNPQGEEKGMAFFYNPLNEDIVRRIRVPLHYTGLSGQAQVSTEGGPSVSVKLDSDQTVTLSVKISAHKRTWFLFSTCL